METGIWKMDVGIEKMDTGSQKIAPRSRYPVVDPPVSGGTARGVRSRARTRKAVAGNPGEDVGQIYPLRARRRPRRVEREWLVFLHSPL